MTSQRRAIPIVAFVVALAALVGVRLFIGASEPDAPAAADDTTPAERADVDSVRFTDVTEAAGLDEPHSDTDLTGESAMTAGAAVADVDDDDDLDVYLTRVGRENRLLLNDGSGVFTDRTEAGGVGGNDPAEGSSAAAFADVDADGDADLVVTGAGRNGTTLYLNDGSGQFSDATRSSGLDDLPALPEGKLAQMHGVSFADYDQDGLLDLLVTHWDDVIPAALGDSSADSIEPDADGSIVCSRAKWLADRGFPRADGAPANRGRLYRNEGDGRFRDVSSEVGLPFREVLGFTGSFADVDGDGWQDLLLTGDFCTSRLFRNVDGTRFEDVTAAAGVGTDENGMGSVVTDLNGDGRPDWLITGIGPVGDEPAPLELGGGFGSSGNRVYLNDGDGTFTDATDQLGLRNGGWGWGAAVEDFANDGGDAVVMTNGYSTGPDDDPDRPSGTPVDDPMQFWLRTDGEHREVASEVGLDDTGLGRALVPFDMDRDGDLDLLVTDFGGEPHLYRNDAPRRHWLGVQLDDPTAPGNPDGIGARVVVTPTDGRPVTKWVIGGGSYESQVPTEVHVGLGDTDTVDRVEVFWPGATGPQVVEDPDTDQLLVVRRDARGG